MTIPIPMAATFELLAEDRRTSLADRAARQADARREAADPRTSPWRLAALANHLDAGVRMAVATNPSSPALTMLRLRRDHDPRVRVVISACRETDR